MDTRIRVLVTGSDGFIGRHLVPYLVSKGHTVIAASRSSSVSGPHLTSVPLPELSAPVDWGPLLDDCDAVVHLAGIAHTDSDDAAYDRVNHQATMALANAAARRGVHLVFISSIAAQSGSHSDAELTEADPPRPINAYGRSKLAAEQAIRTAGGPYTILRPVVIYGEGEKGNLAIIRRISLLPFPLPLGGLKAKRSVLSVQNLNSAIEIVLTNPRSRNEMFLVADPIPVTVADLVAYYRAGIGRPPRLFAMPDRLFEMALRVIGQSSIWHRIGHPLVVRPEKLLALGWRPE